MIISVPRERKTLEKRVAITPQGAKQLTTLGHTVLVEEKAGAGSFFSDEDYKNAGCEIVSAHQELWNRAELLVKVKEPDVSEFSLLRPDLTVFTFLHLAGLPEVAKALVANGTTGLAYEMVQEENGSLPLLAPMSQVAGKLATQNAAHHLLTQLGGRGVLLGGTEQIAAGKVVIIGAGIAGQASAEVASGMGARTVIFDLDQERLDRFKFQHPQIEAFLNTPDTLLAELRDADVVISAVLIPGAKAPRVLSKQHLKVLPRGAVLVDISIDQGGSIEGIRTTSLEQPTYEDDGLIFYAVPNMPSQVARTSTQALTAESLPYIIEIAEKGVNKALLENAALSRSLCTQSGEICNDIIATALNL